MNHPYYKAYSRLLTATLSCVVLLGSAPAYAEAGKGLSRITTGEILWGIFLFAVGTPMLLGLLVFAILAAFSSSKGSLARSLGYPVVAWLICVGILVIGRDFDHVLGWLLVATLMAFGAAVLGYKSGKPDAYTLEQADQQPDQDEPLR